MAASLALTWGLVKGTQYHVNNGTSQAQTPGYRAVTDAPPRMTDMTCFKELLSMLIQESRLGDNMPSCPFCI